MRIAEHRKRAGLTQQELAEKLGIDRSTVTKWETGAAAPLTAKLPEIAKALGCTINDLFAGKKDEIA
ncbi:MAG: helix-turn-helix domain-containing protein [Christensenellales bacterium]